MFISSILARLALATALSTTTALPALAAGNNLTMSANATWDTAGMKFGAGALSGGYGTTAPGACYNSPQLIGTFPKQGSGGISPGSGPDVFGKSIWVKAPTTPPTAPQLIFGDRLLYIAENTAGFPVIGSGSTFWTGQNYYDGSGNLLGTDSIADGAWHLIRAEVVQTTLRFEVSGPSHNPLMSMTETTVPLTGSPLAPVFGAATPLAFPSSYLTVSLPNVVTGIGGGVMSTASGPALAPFVGELDDAACFVTDRMHASGTDTGVFAAWSNAAPGLVAHWALDGNGTDGATWTEPDAPTWPQQIPGVAQFPGPSFAPAPVTATTPTGGFPLSGP